MKAKTKKATAFGVYAGIFTCVLAGAYALQVGGTSPPEAPMPARAYASADVDTYQGDPYAKVRNEVGHSTQGPVVAIPEVGLEAQLTQTGAKAGYLELPDPPLATWYEETVPLGTEKGHSLIASHVDFGAGDQAPFSRLHNVEKGTPIVVRDGRGKLHTYKAMSIEVFEQQELPAKLFRNDGPHRLVLVTCSGPTVNAGRAPHYEYNLVVIAEPVS